MGCTVSPMARDTDTGTVPVVACPDRDATMNLPASAARVAATIADPIERALWVRQYRAGSAYEAAIDGALHYAYPPLEAEHWYRAAMREYDAASSALINYRRARGAK